MGAATGEHEASSPSGRSSGPGRQGVELEAEDEGTEQQNEADDDRDQDDVEPHAGPRHLGQGDLPAAENNGIGWGADWQHERAIGGKRRGNQEEQRVLPEADGDGGHNGQEGGGRGGVAGQLREHEDAEANEAEREEHGHSLERPAQVAEIVGETMFLDIAGQAESAAEQQQDLPGDRLAGIPVHHEITAPAEGDHEEQQGAPDGDGGVGDHRQSPRQERLKNPPDGREHEDDEHGAFAAAERAEAGLFPRDEGGHARDFLAVQLEGESGQDVVDDRQGHQNHGHPEQHPLAEADGDIVHLAEIGCQERVGGRADQGAHAAGGGTVGHRQQ